MERLKYLSKKQRQKLPTFYLMVDGKQVPVLSTNIGVVILN